MGYGDRSRGLLEQSLPLSCGVACTESVGWPEFVVQLKGKGGAFIISGSTRRCCVSRLRISEPRHLGLVVRLHYCSSRRGARLISPRVLNTIYRPLLYLSEVPESTPKSSSRVEQFAKLSIERSSTNIKLFIFFASPQYTQVSSLI